MEGIPAAWISLDLFAEYLERGAPDLGTAVLRSKRRRQLIRACR
jgi:hypothetical protein